MYVGINNVCLVYDIFFIAHTVDAVRTLVILSVIAYFVAAVVAIVAFIKDNEYLSIGAAVATLFEGKSTRHPYKLCQTIYQVFSFKV